MVAFVPRVQANPFAGSGTEKDPYLIFDVDQLICVGLDPLVKSRRLETQEYVCSEMSIGR